MLALLFVAVSLGTGFLTEERRGATRTFMSPVVIHFTSVFFLSAVALFPSHQAKFFAALIVATALIGASVSTYITVQVVRTDMTNYMEDYFAYGIFPGLGYLALLAAAFAMISQCLLAWRAGLHQQIHGMSNPGPIRSRLVCSFRRSALSVRPESS